MYYVIVNVTDLNFLSRISVGPSPFLHPLGWTSSLSRSFRFTTYEEAQATIDFLIYVMDEELDLKIFQMG